MQGMGDFFSALQREGVPTHNLLKHSRNELPPLWGGLGRGLHSQTRVAGEARYPGYIYNKV